MQVVAHRRVHLHARILLLKHAAKHLALCRIEVPCPGCLAEAFLVRLPLKKLPELRIAGQVILHQSAEPARIGIRNGNALHGARR